MSNYSYSYTVESVDEDAGVMLVRFLSETHGDYIASCRIPLESENIDAVVDEYSPVDRWVWLDSIKAPPSVGHSGTISRTVAPEETVESVKEEKLSEVAVWKFQTLKAGVNINGIDVEADQNTLSALMAYKEAFIRGLIGSVEFKTADNSFSVIDESFATQAIDAIILKMKETYERERSLIESINTASSIDALRGINVQA